MFLNMYWHLIEKDKETDPNAQFIIELMPDGTAYVWPLGVVFLKEKHPQEDQDPEGLLADGDFLECSGFYHNIADFMDHTKYSVDRYDVVTVGELDSIRSCRVALKSRKLQESAT